MSNKFDSEIVDSLRILMYGGSEGETKMYKNVVDLAQKLAARDGVSFDRHSNRLVLVMDALFAVDSSEYLRIQHMNDDLGEGTSKDSTRRDHNGKVEILNEAGEVVARQG